MLFVKHTNVPTYTLAFGISDDALIASDVDHCFSGLGAAHKLLNWERFVDICNSLLSQIDNKSYLYQNVWLSVPFEYVCLYYVYGIKASNRQYIQVSLPILLCRLLQISAKRSRLVSVPPLIFSILGGKVLFGSNQESTALVIRAPSELPEAKVSVSTVLHLTDTVSTYVYFTANKYNPSKGIFFNTELSSVDLYSMLTLKWPRGVPRDPRFVFRAFYYFRFRFFHHYFF